MDGEFGMSGAVARWCRFVLDQYDVTKESMAVRRKEMTTSWNCRITPVDYEDEITQCAYIRSDVPFRAHLITKLLRTHPALATLFNNTYNNPYNNNSNNNNIILSNGNNNNNNNNNSSNNGYYYCYNNGIYLSSQSQYQIQVQPESIGLVCIGCGPGTEFIGIINHILQLWTSRQKSMSMQGNTNLPTTTTKLPILKFLLVDRVSSWSKAIDHFETAIRNQLNQLGCSLLFEKTFYKWNLSRLPGDELSPLFLHSLPSCSSSNIFIFSMIFSDLLKEGQETLVCAVENIKALFYNARAGAIFLFVDVEDRWVTQGMVDVLDGNIFSNENSIKLAEYYGAVLPWNMEHKRELSHYFTQGGTPVLTGNLFCLSYTKTNSLI